MRILIAAAPFENATMTADDLDNWNEVLDRQVAQRLAEAGMIAPPIDAVELAKRLGFVVAVDDRQACRARHVLLPGGASARSPAILLRPEPRFERRQWAVAHEIGEHYAFAACAELGVDAAELSLGERERLANALANRLLLPSPWFFRDGAACGWDLAELKRRYVTASYELLARRMLDAAAPVVVTIVDRGRVTFRRNNGGTRLAKFSSIERDVWSAAHETGAVRRGRDRRCVVDAWPIHEPEWKREIVRTAPVDEADAV